MAHFHPAFVLLALEVHRSIHVGYRALEQQFHFTVACAHAQDLPLRYSRRWSLRFPHLTHFFLFLFVFFGNSVQKFQKTKNPRFLYHMSISSINSVDHLTMSLIAFWEECSWVCLCKSHKGCTKISTPATHCYGEESSLQKSATWVKRATVTAEK